MKRLAYFFLLTLVMVDCGSRSGYFKFEGHLLNLNQGEFYVYSTDGVVQGIDTIKVEGGRFTYETPCDKAGTVIIVFPNQSELPVMAAPGKSVTISGDASHLKEIEVKGTDENKLMTAFRLQTASAIPQEADKHVAEFIKNNPKSLSAVYVLRQYVVSNSRFDPAEGLRLAEMVNKAQPENGNVARMVKFLKVAKQGKTGTAIPSFTAQDTKGKTVTAADLRGKIAVVYAWTTWDSESAGAVERLKRLLNGHESKLALVAISLDASRKAGSLRHMKDTTATVNICDQLMFDSPLLEKFALTGVRDNVLYNAQGRIIERGLAIKELETKLKTLLNI